MCGDSLSSMSVLHVDRHELSTISDSINDWILSVNLFEVRITG